MKETKAHINLKTGKIYGCKKGSLKWYHEKGHLAFQDKFSFSIMINAWFDNAFFLLIVLTFIARPFIYIMILNLARQWLFSIYEEAWCNRYATMKYLSSKYIPQRKV